MINVHSGAKKRFESAAEEEEIKKREAEEALAARRSELAMVEQQDRELQGSEAELSHRLWEVQEARRRNAAIREQLQAAVEEAAKSFDDLSAATI